MERLTAADLMMLWPDDFGWPEYIGALVILDGSTLVDEEGRLKIELVREVIASRLSLVPRFRQVIHRPRRGFGWPLWVDAPTFDIAHHVRTRTIGDEGGDVGLLDVCEELRRQPFDRSRPLWAMWFLTGLADGRIGVFMKLHHAIADGVAGVATLAAFVDLTSDAEPTPAPTWRPVRPPTPRELFFDNVNSHARAIRRALVRLLHPRATIRDLRRAWPALAEVFAEGRAPVASVNQPIGPARTFTFVRTGLAETKRIAKAHGAKVNDVLLSAVAAGYRELLLARGEPVHGVSLRALVPISLHKEGDGEGNLDGSMVVPLAVGEPDHHKRLALIAAETTARKTKTHPASGTIFRYVFIQRMFLRMMRRQRLVNAYTANVPGPPMPVYLAGAEVLEIFPIVPISGNVTIGVGALSYAGRFNITVVADRDHCPDVEVFVQGLRRSLETMQPPVELRTPA